MKSVLIFLALASTFVTSASLANNNPIQSAKEVEAYVYESKLKNNTLTFKIPAQSADHIHIDRVYEAIEMKYPKQKVVADKSDYQGDSFVFRLKLSRKK